MNILMVCLGNICRSPLAEGVLRHKVLAHGLNWHIDSAGTSSYHIGCTPHKLSQKVAQINNIDIGEHSCRSFEPEDMIRFDKIYVMDENNYDEVKRISGDSWNSDKVDFVLNEAYPGECRSVPDPYYGGEDGYYAVYALLDEACQAIVNRYKTHKR